MFEPLSYPTDMEVENLFSTLPDDTAKQLHDLVKQLRKDRPGGSGLNLGNKTPFVGSLEQAKHYVEGIMKHLWFHRQQSFLLTLEASSYRQKSTKLKKENEILAAENKELKLANERQKKQIAELLGFGSGKEKTQHSSEKKKHPSADRKRGAPVGHRGATRDVPDYIDSVESFDPVMCACGNTEINPTDKYDVKYVEDIEFRVKCTKRKYYRGICSKCGKEVRNPEAAGTPVVLGDTLKSVLAAMRYELGGTYRNLSNFTTRILNLPVTPAGIYGLLKSATGSLSPFYNAIGNSLPQQHILHGDETGWKMDGANWYLWCMCNKNLAYFHADKSRGRKVIKNILGETFDGLFHADFYAAYSHLPNLQRCLIHYIRDIKKEIEIQPDETIFQSMLDEVQSIIEEAVKLQKADVPTDEKQNQKQNLFKRFEKLATTKTKNKTAEKLLNRIHKHKNSLLNFVDYPDAEYHNNRAERTIRPSVIARKISFGNRTVEGARNHSILVSTLHTIRLNNKDPVKFIHDAISKPNETLQSFNEMILG